MSDNKLELLSPAKNLECGIAAIRHGADAVYIGAPRFSAREAAGNSVEEIEKLVRESHLFGAKTYVALNTILFDNELEEAERMIRQVYEAGADALIIQDFGILEMDLPPIALHASTQANNFTVDKIKFLEAVGFKRAVLARELSLNQIIEIARETSIELEAFVHGSLCVSLSGQCFMSFVQGGRSANRGACAQPCRKKYSLSDAGGKKIIENKYLLSLKDLNRSASLREMADSGVRSFKIEGRLKDMDYVKNITAYYRKELDLILNGNSSFEPASFGKTSFFFMPDPVKTFHRGATEYYLRGRKDTVLGMDSPKSVGEEMGEVIRITRDAIVISGAKEVHNNDGLTFLSRNGDSAGLKVNKVENGCIFPDRMNDVFVGARIFRNLDHNFQLALTKKSSERKIPVSIELQATENGFVLSGNSENSYEIEIPKTPARNPEQSRENIFRQLAKSGDSPFFIESIDTGGNEQYFFTSQQLNELRRGLLSQISETLENHHHFTEDTDSHRVSNSNVLFPKDSFHFENNISNRLALQFYRRHGIQDLAFAVEKRALDNRLQVMITRHCLKYELGFCQRFGGAMPEDLTEPFTLQDGDHHFDLEFDCKNCMMKIFRNA